MQELRRGEATEVVLALIQAGEISTQGEARRAVEELTGPSPNDTYNRARMPVGQNACSLRRAPVEGRDEQC